MIDWIEDWLLRLGFLNSEGLMARAALCAEDNQRLARGNRPEKSRYFAGGRVAASAITTASARKSYVDK